MVTGPNGDGKSSLLRTLAGLVSLMEGTLRLEGGETDLTPFEHTHYFGHQDSVKPALSVQENLAFWRDFSAPAKPNTFESGTIRPMEALDLLGIDHTARLPAAYLSAGQKRRLSLARLLVTPRPIWLMDEPTSALDTKSEATLLDLMNTHLALGGMIITATHTPLALTPMRKLHLDTASSLPEEMA